MSTTKPFIGIDFGTSKSVMSWYDHSIQRADIILNRERQQETPSVVYLGANASEDLVGVLAERKLEDARAEQNRFVVSAKRYLKGDRDVPITYLDDKNIYPVDIIAKILRKLKDDAERLHFNNFSSQPVSNLVITHPASFDPFQCTKIERAAKQAGFTEVRLLPEPIAAAIAYARFIEQMGTKVGNKLLVYDFGGGTFDIAILARNTDDFSVVSPPQGLIDCGGDDLDGELYDYCDEIARQTPTIRRGISLTDDRDLKFLRECRRRKENLSGENNTIETFSSYLPARQNERAVMFEHSIKRTVFEERIQKHIDRTVTLTRKVLDDAYSKNHKVDTVVLIGGSSSVPLVQKSLSGALPAQPIQVKEWQQRDVAVALGAAYHAQKLWGLQPSTEGKHYSSPLPPLPPATEKYREAFMGIWIQTRRLTQNQVNELTALASKFGIIKESAMAIERQITGFTKEEILQNQYYAAIAQYRTKVANMWRQKRLSPAMVNDLGSEASRLELSRDVAATVEREIMGDIKEAILDHQTPIPPPPPLDHPFVPPQPVKPHVQIQKWRFTRIKIIPILLFLVSAFFTLGALGAGGSTLSLLVVAVPLDILCIWWFLRKPRVKIPPPPPSR